MYYVPVLVPVLVLVLVLVGTAADSMYGGGLSRSSILSVRTIGTPLRKISLGGTPRDPHLLNGARPPHHWLVAEKR